MGLSILQVASAFPHWGGTELHILNLSEQLQRRGHDVTVACRPGGWVEARAHERGLPTVPVTVKRQQDWRDYGRLRDFLRSRRVDVLHVHWSLDIIVAGTAALWQRVPVRVLSRHMPYPLNAPVGVLLYSHLLYTRLVALSQSVADTLLGCGVRTKNLEVIHHGTDVEAFAQTALPVPEARRALGIAPDRVAVGVIGRLSPEKGHAVLLQAARELGDHSPVQYVIIGDGPDDAALRRQVETLGLQDRVLFTGFRADVNSAMAALDIVTLPSTWAEPCSAVVQQAMALSKPVIGTRAGGTPEMILDGVTGLLVPPSESGPLAEAIAALSADADARERMGRAGRERVEALFSLRMMTDKIEALYLRQYEQSLKPTSRRTSVMKGG
ncbi:MAG: glycosyltransferase family 4 protein [Armatimonadota bacterium]|nr:glycosyltransferase family 4 protein [Armatimonadota bacterium]